MLDNVEVLGYTLNRKNTEGHVMLGKLGLGMDKTTTIRLNKATNEATENRESREGVRARVQPGRMGMFS